MWRHVDWVHGSSPILRVYVDASTSRAELATDLHADLKPQDAVETLLAERVIGYAWRLRRGVRIELGIFAEDATCERQVELGQAFVRGGTDSCSETSHRLWRYESALERGLLTTLRELHWLQVARRGETAMPPVQVDGNVVGVP